MVVFTCFSNWSRLSRNDRYIINLAISDSLMPLCAFPLTISSSFSHEWIFDVIGTLSSYIVTKIYMIYP
ncbi:hypothetical protein DPMN_132341 [Dreissena polymorpha]|uniref:Uncharacterized protein n=1 Tax=Dreissena polymorpha TaxID=45954 RepID=A0A9D4JD07_DREPO|nr:hypothetical protein DPMN_132341 [Dreissena polymorpha]